MNNGPTIWIIQRYYKNLSFFKNKREKSERLKTDLF